jgi:DDE superfamily endonuclease
MVAVGIGLGPRGGQRAAGAAAVPGSGHRPHERGVLVLDDTGDRKDGTATAPMARQYLGSVGKIDKASWP